MKGFYDPALLSRMYQFEGESLATAIRATSLTEEPLLQPNRLGLPSTPMIPHELPLWKAFVRRTRFGDEAGAMTRLVAEIRPFAC
jgi:hypothetical protein